MDSKFYVSYEAAKLLKEKGYNEECATLHDCIFNEIIPARSVGLYRNECIKNDYYCSCPTKAEAIDWLESKGHRIIIIYDWIECKWYFKIINGSPTIQNITELEVSDSVFYETRLEAEDAGIKKALKLILEEGE